MTSRKEIHHEDRGGNIAHRRGHRVMEEVTVMESKLLMLVKKLIIP